jgi:hypothetical protein
MEPLGGPLVPKLTWVMEVTTPAPEHHESSGDVGVSRGSTFRRQEWNALIGRPLSRS